MTLEEMVAALQELLSSVDSRGDGSDLTEEEAARASDLTDQINAAKARGEVRSAAQALITPVRPTGVTFVAPNSAEEVELRFDNALRNADHVELRAQSEGVGSQGGFLVQTGFRNKVVEKRLAYGGFQTVAETITTGKGEPLEWVTVDDTSNVGAIVAENGVVATGGADLVFGTATLGAYKWGTGGASNLPLKISWELLQDDSYDIRGKLTGWLGTRIARAQAPKWLTGTGVGEPQGLLTPKTPFDEIASTTTPTYAELLGVIHALDPEYRDGAVWVMNDATLAVLRAMVDTNARPLLSDANNGLSQGPGGETLLGYKVVIDQAMPSIAATGSTKFIAFGRMQDAYVIRRVKNFELVVLNELYALNGQVGFIGWERADGVVQDPNAYVVLASHA